METLKQVSGPLPPVLCGGNARIRSAAVEVALGDLDEGDLLLIQTANSLYSFSVSDARAKSGMLMGGQLGERGAAAWLIGAQENTDDESGIDDAKLAAGLRAVFLVATGDEPRRLVTSTIKRLTQVKMRIERLR